MYLISTNREILAKLLHAHFESNRPRLMQMIVQIYANLLNHLEVKSLPSFKLFLTLLQKANVSGKANSGLKEETTNFICVLSRKIGFQAVRLGNTLPLEIHDMDLIRESYQRAKDENI